MININLFDRKTMSEKYKVINSTVPTGSTITEGSAIENIAGLPIKKYSITDKIKIPALRRVLIKK
jgi:hypothetical protein